MPAIIEPPPEVGAPLPPLWKRIAWFAGLSVTGAASTAAIAYALRLLLT
ncbi:MAG: DUF2474 domain-containing protein [Pseudomonadota bacterium]|nr:MAG: DUF2474 domain-containing protein [Phenylobacterium zucineum]